MTISLVTVGRHFPPGTVWNLRDEPANSADHDIRFGREELKAAPGLMARYLVSASIEPWPLAMTRFEECLAMNRQVFGIRRVLRTVLALSLLAGTCTTVMAQGFRGGGPPGGGGGGMPSPEDSFRRMDRNQNGQIDPDEIPSFLRDMYAKAGMDISRPISQQEFLQGSQKIREQFEQARTSGDFSQFRRPDSGGGPSGASGGPPSFPSRSESDRGDGRRSEEPSRDERRDERDRSRDERRESSSSGKSSKKSSKPKARVTQDLPAEFRDKDKNGDGQIGLYEWDRKAFAQFFALDRNGDGLLTPDELIAATKKSSASDKSSSKSVTTTSTTAPSEDSKSSPSTSDSTKPSDSSTKPVSSSSSGTESSAAVRAFGFIDSNRDGKLSEEEWRRSRTTRGKFEKAKIELKFPVDQAQFVELYNKVEAQ